MGTFSPVTPPHFRVFPVRAGLKDLEGAQSFCLVVHITVLLVVLLSRAFCATAFQCCLSGPPPEASSLHISVTGLKNNPADHLGTPTALPLLLASPLFPLLSREVLLLRVL